MRDDKWLFQKLDEVWDKYFPDMPQDNDVHIIWGRKARTRLGSIKQVQGDRLEVKGGFLKPETSNLKSHPATIITINSLFKDPKIPEYVVVSTIAHELSHYAHGFNSPLEQKFNTPHAGGIVHREMRSRGLENIEKKQKRWLKENWKEYIEGKFKPVKRRRRRIIIKWI